MNKNFHRLTAVLLAAAMALTGCGRQSAKFTSAEAGKLLSADYEAEYIFLSAGLPVDSQKPHKNDKQMIYFPVDSDRYKTTADLKKLLDSVYTAETAERIMSTEDTNGALLYTDIDGVLCRSAAPIVHLLGSQLDNSTVVLQEGATGKAATFTVMENADDGGQSRLTMEAVNGKGGWRLTADRTAANRVQIKAGAGAAMAEGELRTAADKFLAALAAGDVAAVEELTKRSDPMGTEQQYSYDFLGESGVTSAKVLETVSESEFGGEYLAELQVSGGNKTFPEGTGRWRITVATGFSEDFTQSGATIQDFRQEGETPYELLPVEQQTNNAINQLMRLRTLNGAIQFASAKELSAEVITEAALYELSVANPEVYTGFTKEQVQLQVNKNFGIEGFEPSQNFYGAETKSYIYYGRGGVPTNSRLVQVEEGNGLVKIAAYHYGDPLQLRPTATILYTLQNNWNGSYRFVSGVLETK